MTQAEMDARSGVFRYTIYGHTHRAEANSEAEAALWCALGLMHFSESSLREWDAAGRPIAPPGIPSLADMAGVYRDRARRLVHLATTAEGYMGPEATAATAPPGPPASPRWRPGGLAEEIVSIVFAFDDKDRQAMVRNLADRVERLERERGATTLAAQQRRGP